MADPTLHVLACAHGTDDPAGRALVDGLRRALAEALPGTVVHEAYVDVQDPALTDVLAHLPPGEPAVVAPLLLSAGHHTGADIAAAVAARDRTVAADPLGPDPRLADVLAERVAATAAMTSHDDIDVILAAAGTRVGRGREQVHTTAAALAERLGTPVTAAFGAAASPSVPDAVAAARADGRRVVVASYLLAPGVFHRRLAEAGADVVTDPLLPHPCVAQVAADRVRAAAARLA